MPESTPDENKPFELPDIPFEWFGSVIRQQTQYT